MMRRILVGLCAALAISTSSAESVSVGIPDFERDFIGVIVEYAEKYQGELKPLKKSVLVNQRLEAWSKLKGDPRKVVGWYGAIEDLGTNSDGDAYITVSLPGENATLGTWNNAFSDGAQKTLIKQGTPLYNSIAEMDKGNVVKFSGALGRLKNVTENGKMTDPEFVFKFTNVEKVGDVAGKMKQ